MVPRGTVWLFANEAQVILEAAAPFNWGKVQGVNVHGIWILNQVRGLRVMGEISVWVLWGQSSLHQSDLSGYLSLETEMGSFLIPASDGGGDLVHSLDSFHNLNWDSS